VATALSMSHKGHCRRSHFEELIILVQLVLMIHFQILKLGPEGIPYGLKIKCVRISSPGRSGIWWDKGRMPGR